MPQNKKKDPPEMTQNFPIVGVGASAGGLDAFKKFLGPISPNSGMAYVLVQHLAPSHESILPDILSKFTELPVHEITDEINLAPNRVYIIPENKILTTFDGVLKLSPRDMSSKKNMPIDIFFKSLAEVHKSFAIGTVLSGTGFDGTDGLKTIKELGGVTYAQDTDTAVFDGMPQNAINAGTVDFILPPEDIPPHLLHIAHAYRVNHGYPDDLELPKDEADIFKQILRVIRLRTGNDFSHYKQPTLRRRIARRMVTTKQEDPIAYLNYLRADKDEQDALFNDILIPVSHFFRDTATFEALYEKVFPDIFKTKAAGESVRIWVAGCSRGEEAYSLAICLHELLVDKFPDIKVQIFATDISENVIMKARSGLYNKQELQGISETRLQNYFTKADGQYHVNKAIRDLCVFAVHSFIKDPPFARIDLVSCRNVLIYLDSFLQKKALTTFHYALKDQGILLLGKSETTSSVPSLFEPLLKNHKIYKGKKTLRQYTPASFESPDLTSNSKPYSPVRNINEPDFQKLAFNLLFSKYTPAGVIINEQHDIVHFHGDTGPFLVSSPGKPNFNIFKMAREGLGFELRNAMLKAKPNIRENIVSKNIPIKGKDYLASFEIVALASKNEPHYLILFYKKELPAENKISAASKKSADQTRILQLEAELDQLREDIRTITEVQEISNEELQSANEELLSNSEELQSLNEELETSMEELQSSNEELTTVNDELMDRQEQLISARMYSEAIVETICEPLIILTKEMRVKSANSAFYKYFQVTDHEIEGRSFFDIGKKRWNNEQLRILLEDVLPGQKKMEGFEITGSFSFNEERTMLLNARKIVNGHLGEQLVLLAFDDVTEDKVSQLLRESNERFKTMANTSPIMMWMSDIDKKVIFLNKSWLDFTGKNYESQAGDLWAEALHQDDIQNALKAYANAENSKSGFDIEYRMKRHDGNYRWVSCKATPRFTNDGDFLGYIGGCMDIDEQKNFYAELENKVALRTNELKESEAFLQSILNTTQNLIYIYDLKDKKIVFANQKSVEATGYTQEDLQNAVGGDLFTKQIHPEDLETVAAHRKQLLETIDGEMTTVEFRLKNNKGEWANQLSRDLIFKRDEKGRATHYIGVATDISDIRLANESLKSKNQELQYSNIELASFSSIASHDLKEPLRKIQLFSKLIIAAEQDKVTDESQHFLERIINSAGRMQQLIDDLISYSRTSREKIKFVETDLNLLLQDVIEDLTEVIEQSKAVINIPEMPFIAVLPSQFRQLFLNLFSNSIKYTKGNVTPEISVVNEKASYDEIVALKGNPEIGYFKFTVSDNGIGFPNEYKETIFEPFKRLHSKDEYTGTGIGLAICKKIMLNHKGFITAESRESNGSTFHIYVPDRRK